MITDLRTSPGPAIPSGAVLVVGSGAAGLALARRLDDVGRPVVLLESGGDTTGDGDAADLNEGSSTGLPFGLETGRSRVLGGTTALWHGQCMRLHPVDVEHRTWVPGSGWPFGLNELTTHYHDAERWLGVTGSGYGAERWQEHPKLPPIDWDPAQLQHDFTEYTAAPLLGRVHRPALVASRQAQVIVNATVGRVLLDGPRVRGVLVFRPDGSSTEFAATQVVLAAGAIENARLLQLSDPDGVGLGAGREHVGRYLQDHPIIRTAEVLADDYRFLQDRYVALHRGRRRLFAKVRLAEQVQRDHSLLDATAVFVHEHDQPALDAARRLVLAARARKRPDEPWRDLGAALRAPGPVTRDTYRRYVRGLATGTRPRAVWLQLWLEQVADPASRVTLGTDRDRFGMRRAEVDWRVGDLEIETSRQLTRMVAGELDRLGLAKVRELDAMHDDDAWRATVTDAYHPSGTTRMSTDPSEGVVDPDLAVHGVGGLSIVGGSVFPTGGYANPTLTIVALALRLADRLAVTAV